MRGGSYPSTKVQSVYSTAPAYWAIKIRKETVPKNLRSVVSNTLDCGSVVSEFELQSRYYDLLWTCRERINK